MATTFYYRLPSDNDVHCLLWSGRVSAQGDTHRHGVNAVREAIGASSLPANTLVVSEHELATGWDAKRIRAATLPKRPTAKQYAKTVADVPTSFEDVQSMMKSLGLA
jgi:hypothetical protein